MIALDDHGQPLLPAVNRARRIDRDISELLGVVKGMLCDGVVSDAEAKALERWLRVHPDALAHWAVRAVNERVQRAMADGVLDDDEQTELHGLLDSLIGGTITTVIGVDAATALPLDDPLPSIRWAGEVYVFTGQFAYGTRSACEREVFHRGGDCQSNLTKRTSYLVVGNFGSRDWAQTSFGRKIEKAVGLRTAGAPLRIVAEDHWARALA